MERDIAQLTKLQDVFAAAASHALLIVLQGMDSSGKDSTIKHVMSGLNPQGIDVHSFKPPSREEYAHDFLWRAQRVLPERGRIGIFNRSYYEEVVVVRVHEELLALEATEPGDGLWHERFEDINAFERHLVRNETTILKFFLHISKDEQRKRLLERLDDPEKNWKFSFSDARERNFWDSYQCAYERMLTATSTPWAPWYVVPADHKWFVRAAIADAIVSTLDGLRLRYPPLPAQNAATLKELRDGLVAEASSPRG
jgi:PPK2 family polyphosphate:nucleotide phosphotransferase